MLGSEMKIRISNEVFEPYREVSSADISLHTRCGKALDPFFRPGSFIEAWKACVLQSGMGGSP